jgi:hypothetical protein
MGWREPLQEHCDRLVSYVAEHPTEVTQIVKFPRSHFERCAADDAAAALQLDWQEANAMTRTQMALTPIACLVWNQQVTNVG